MCSQIWPSPLADECQPTYLPNLERKNQCLDRKQGKHRAIEERIREDKAPRKSVRDSNPLCSVGNNECNARKKKGHKTTYIYHDSQASECVDAEEVRRRTPHACKKQRARPKNNYMEPPQIKSWIICRKFAKNYARRTLWHVGGGGGGGVSSSIIVMDFSWVVKANSRWAKLC
jgi:hypothetical protein